MTTIGSINIPLKAEGLPDVLAAFSSMEKRYLAVEKKMSDIAAENSRLLEKLAKKDSDTKVKEEEKALKEKEKLARQEVKDRDRFNKMIHESYQKRTAQEIKEEEKKLAEQEKLDQKELRNKEILAKKITDIETKEANKSARERLQISKKLAGGIMSDLRSTASFAAGVFGGLGALAGGVGLYNGLDQFLGLDKQASEFSHNAKVTGSNISAQEFKDLANTTAAKNNMKPGEAGEIAKTIFAKTGSADKARELTPKIAELAFSEYVNPVDLGSMIGQLSVQNPGKSSEQLMKLAGSALRTTQFGSIEVNDLVKIGAEVTGSNFRYAGNSDDNIIKSYAALQVANRTSRSPEEAATSYNRFTDDLIKHSSKIKGFDVFTMQDGQKKLKAIDVLIPGLMNSIGFDPSKIKEIFGERGARFYNAFGSAYSQKTEELKGSGLSRKEIDRESKQFAGRQLTDLFKGIQVTQSQIDQSHQERMDSPAEKFNKLVLDLQNKFTDLAPAILQVLDNLKPLIPLLGNLLPAFGDILKWAASNPFEAVGGLVGAAIVKSIMTAAIGQVVATALTGSISTVLGFGGAAAGAAGTGGSLLGGIALGTAAAPISVVVAALGVGVAMAWWAGKTDALDEKEKDSRLSALRGSNQLLHPKDGETFTDSQYRTEIDRMGKEIAYEKDPAKQGDLISIFNELLQAYKSSPNIEHPNDRQGEVNKTLADLRMNGVKVTMENGHATRITINRDSQGVLETAEHNPSQN